MFGLLFALLTFLIALSKAETFTTYPYPTESFLKIPIINSISTDITSTTEKSGSLSGGNTLYIRGTSLVSDLRKVVVYIGRTVCPLDYAYTSDFQIACTVPPASQSGTLPVKVISAGSQATCDSEVCQYTYSAQLTPRVNYFAPPAVIGNDAFTIIGAWYGANPSQLQISLNGGFCPRYLSTLETDTTQCVPEGLPAGRYTINTNVPTFGIAKKTDSATALANDDYSRSDFVIIPEISKLSGSTGPTSGATITITGRGFSANNADNEVLYEGQHCDVTSSSYSTIKCTLTTPPFRTGGDSRPGHGGLTHRLYPQSTSFAALKKSYDYIIRNLVSVDSYGRLAAFEVESERPVLFQSEVLEGYFLAPKTGPYKFMLSASSFAELYISTTPLAETPVTKIATVNTASNFRDFYTETTQVSDDMVLTEGNYYFLQAYHITSHPNHLTVGVRIPNDAKTDSAPREVVSVKINADVERFEATFTIQDSTEELKLSFADLESETFVYPAASYEIEKAFLDLNIEAKVLSRTFLNSTDDQVTQENATKIQYHLRLYTQPTFVTLPLVSNDDVGQLIQVFGNSPSSLVTGSFELNFNGATISLNYDSTTANVQAEFDSALGQDFATRVFRNGRVEEGAEFIIYFDGVDTATSTPAVTLKSSSITGGKTTPTVIIAVKQDDASTDVVLPVIPPQLLRTHETSAQITVRSNGLLASCKGNCKYGPAVGTNWPTITGYTRNGQTLTITFINADTKVAADFDKVLFGGNTATVSSYDATTQTLTCTIPLNTDNSARLVAGTHVPQVRVKSVGYALINYDVPTVTVTPTITAATPAELANGLVEITIEGTGYGFSSTENFGATVTIGDVACSLTSMTNTKIVCRANIAITNGPLVLTVNKVTIQTAFTFKKDLETQQITNNCNLDVTGTGFTDATVVMLINSDETVQEKCRACTRTSTLIKCNVCDLPNGEYTAVVNGATSTTPLTGVFFTIDHSVSSISPSSGSLLGGTVLTITGAGFSTTLEDNEVTIGTADAELVCKVLTATSTQITCKVPDNEAEFDNSTPTTVTVWKGDNKAVCTGTCTYTFSSSKTPTITNANLLTIKAGDSVSLQGTMFSASTQFTFGGLSAVVGSVTASLATITVPAISANSAVEFTATDPALGDFAIAGTVVFSSPLTLTDVTPKTGSQGGSVLTLTGQGFSKNTIVEIGNTRCTTLTFDLTKITCRSSPSSSGAITVSQNGYHGITCSGCSYAESATVTPTVTSFTPATSGDTTTVTIVGTQLDLGTPAVTLTFGATTVSATISSSSATSIVAVFAGTPVGKYQFDVRSGGHFAVITSPTLTIPYDQVIASSVVPNAVSQAGFRSLELDFQGHPLPLEASALSVKVAGIDCPITENTATSITCTIPPLTLSNAAPLATEGIIKGDVFGSSTSGDVVLAFDDSTTTSWEGASGSECFIGIDIGEELRAKVSQIDFYPSTSIDPSKLQNGVFEGSVDGDDFTTIVTVTDSVYQGWNVLHLAENVVAPYRYVRYRQAEATSKCEFAELRFKGTVVSALEDADPSVVAISQVTVTANGNINTAIVADIEYRQDATPTVTGITPKVGTSAGGTTVDIQGTNFPVATSDIKVTIDGVTCTVSTVTATHVTCVTGALPAIADRTGRLTGEIKIIVEGKGQAVATGVSFLYAERWSQAATWSCDGIPIEGDSVYVPEGMNLLVDLSPPKLNAVVVLGGLFFEDKEINFGAEYILVRGGHLQIGTEAEPVTNKITITLYGDSQGNQIAIFGNKVIGAYEGTVDIHGTPRAALETTLATTSKIGDSHITVDDASGFKVGDYIVISSTSASPAENEKRKIIKLDGNKVYFDTRLSYVHLAEQEAIPFAGATQTVQLKAVIILLTRNVVIQGDDSSTAANYGAHLLFNDPQSGLTTVRISNVEIRNAGQAGYVDRYPVNFQNLGDQFNSYIKESSIHSTFNKGIQVRGTQYLKVSSNILFNVKGEAIVLTDGVERFNRIEKNTIIGIHEDVFPFNALNNPKAVKIANPNNFITKNKIIGAPFGGFHLAFPATAQGAAYGQIVCPQGERLGSFADNSVLSTYGVGVTIDAHYPRTFACLAARTEDADPYAANPPVPATYRGLSVMRTDRGLVAQSVGAVIFDNFKIADTWAACINIMNIANAPLKSSKITNTLVVGRLKLTHGAINAVSSVGILVPESDGFTLDTVLFAHFSASVPAIQTIRASTSTTTFVKGLKLYDVQTQVSLYRHIIYDEDGSLTGSADSYVMYDFPHARVPECTNATISGVLVCDNTVEVRALTFTNFPQKTLKILRLEEGVNPDTVESTHVTSLTYTAEQGVPFVTGYPYRASFGDYVELVGGVIENSPLASEDDLPITLAFENTGTQIDFNVVRMTYPATTANCSNSTAFDMYEKTGIADKWFGDFFNDFATTTLYIAVTGRDVQGVADAEDVSTATINAFVGTPTDPGTNPGNNGTDNSTNGTNCTANGTTPCNSTGNSTNPTDPENPTPQPILDYRLWSNASGWPSGVKPAAGSNVVIEADDTVFLDENSASLNSLTINGQLILGLNESTAILTSKRILVRGRLEAGNETNPFTGSATIRLTGTSADPSLSINGAVATGPKVLAVTGELSLYGKAVTTLVRLTANAAAGATQITVDGDISGFAVGDELLISASGSTASESEVKIIQSVNTDTKTITLTTGLSSFHYGSASTLEVSNGMTVDMRTEVLHMTRNIKIEGTQEGNIGARIMVTTETISGATKVGVINMKYVSLSYCGQIDTLRSALAFESTSGVSSASTVYGSVFRNSVAQVVSFRQASKVTFEQNVIYNAYQHGIRFYATNNDIKVLNNAIIGVTQASTATLVQSSAGILIVDATNTAIQIKNNIVAGCGFSCYFIRPPACSATSTYLNNVAHSGKFGYVGYSDRADCISIANFTAYRMEYGVISDTPVTRMEVKGLALLDNGVSLNIVNSGSGATVTSTKYPTIGYDGVRNVSIEGCYFAGVALTTCAACYSQASTCSNRYAIGLNRFTDLVRDTTLTATRLNALGSRYSVSGNYFDNYSDSLVSGCINNKVFLVSGQARDFIPYIKTASNTIKNVNENALARFQALTTGDNNCGPDSECTLELNTLIEDNDGLLTTSGTQPTVILPNNAGVMNSSLCTAHSSINGYVCKGAKYGLLSFQVMDNDKYSTKLSPVVVNKTGFTSSINSHRTNYATFASDTQKFISLIETEGTYNVYFPDKIPREVVYEMEGANSDYVLLKIPYPITKTVMITNLATGEKGTSIMTKQTNAGVFESTDKCGAYSINNVTGEITAKITAGADCALIIEKRNSIVLRIRFTMPLADFFAKGLTDKFIAKIAQILNIASSRIRLVMLYSGSTGVIAAIDSQTQGDDSRTAATTELQTAQTALANALASNQMDLDGETLTVIDSSMESLYSTGEDTDTTNPGTPTEPETPTAQEQESSSMVWLAIVIPIVVILLIGIPLILWKLKKNRAAKYQLKRLPLPQVETA